jgi:hypothetical protein
MVPPLSTFKPVRETLFQVTSGYTLGVYIDVISFQIKVTGEVIKDDD